MEDFDSIDDFVDLIPEKAKDEPLVVYVMMSGRQKTPKLRLAFLAGPLAEIGGPRYLVRWSPKRRVLRVESGDRHPYEPFRMGKGSQRDILSCPVPIGFAIDGDRCMPEFYVDQVGRAINIEIPAPVGQRQAQLPQPSAPRALPAPTRPERFVEPVGQYDADLAATLGLTATFPTKFGDIALTPAEAKVLELLYRREQASKDAIMMATAIPSQEDDRDDKLADVYVCKLRKKLEPLSIEIETIRGEGYRINPKAKRFIARLIGEAFNG